MADGKVIIDTEIDENGAKKGLSKLGGLAKGAAAGITGALGAGIAAIGALGKEAIGAYASFEQLTGGVQTLFGAGGQSIEDYAKSVGKSTSEVKKEYDKLMKAEKTVLKDADEAYKTAGMSANKYMETVTSFSAALNASLDGNTKKSAESANMAVVDMADNANKMGTAIESIQNAYQGFDKQNYTMLDNLKLGYGGTKEEMQRLLKDAEEITGIKYDITNLNDVFQAIHVIQGELGITGTTAKEAATTIEGSTNAMKAAWENLLVGVADDNADFDALIDNFVSSVLTVVDNLDDRIVTTVGGAGDLIVSLVEKFVPKIGEMLPGLIENLLPAALNAITSVVNGIVTALPSLISSITTVLPSVLTNILATVSTLIPTLINSITTMLPLLIQSGIELLNSLAQGFINELPTFITTVLESIDGLADMLTKNLPVLINAGISMLFALVQGLTEALPTFIEKVPTIIGKFADLINDNMPTVLMAGIQLIIALAKGLISAIPTLLKEIPNIFKAILKVWQAIQWANLGKSIITFLKKGVTGMLGDVTKIGKTIFDKMKNSSIKDLPKQALTWGRDMIVGFIKGIKNKISSLTKGIKEVASVVSKYLHFSVPDIGPLADADTWMPDMIDLLVGGMRDNKYKLAAEAENLASTLSLESKGLSSMSYTPGYSKMVVERNNTSTQTVRVVPDDKGIFKLVKEQERMVGDTI